MYCPLPEATPELLCPPTPSQMDPVQKAVISHTFGVPSPLKKKLFISCNICHLRFNSAVRGSSGNMLGKGLGGERAGDWASGILPGGMGVANGPWSQISIRGCKRGTPGPSFIHPLLYPESSALFLFSPTGTPFPSCASPLCSGPFCKREDLPSWPGSVLERRPMYQEVTV